MFADGMCKISRFTRDIKIKRKSGEDSTNDGDVAEEKEDDFDRS